MAKWSRNYWRKNRHVGNVSINRSVTNASGSLPFRLFLIFQSRLKLLNSCANVADGVGAMAAIIVIGFLQQRPRLHQNANGVGKLQVRDVLGFRLLSLSFAGFPCLADRALALVLRSQRQLQ